MAKEKKRTSRNDAMNEVAGARMMLRPCLTTHCQRAHLPHKSCKQGQGNGGVK
jgi:hypothetical protein